MDVGEIPFRSWPRSFRSTSHREHFRRQTELSSPTDVLPNLPNFLNLRLFPPLIDSSEKLLLLSEVNSRYRQRSDRCLTWQGVTRIDEPVTKRLERLRNRLSSIFSSFSYNTRVAIFLEDGSRRETDKRRAVSWQIERFFSSKEGKDSVSFV